MVLGVIPARAGSKGIPNKNIRLVRGKPLLAYAIECGLRSPSIDRLIVSTDCEKIAAIGRKWGADVPFIRPSDLAGDTVPMQPVLEHAVLAVEKCYNKTVRCVVLLDPTAPLRTVDDIENCMKLFKESDCDAVISGNRAHRSPYFNMVVLENSYVQLALPTRKAVGRRQDSPEVYDLNTVVWIYSRKAIIVQKARIPKKTLLYLVPPERAIDLDNELDLNIVEYLLNQQ